ncbi:MAG: tetratricopeptide repeat protein [Bacteroidaceae bacterium]
MRNLFLSLVLFVFALSLQAQTKANADSAYSKEKYEEAAKIYEQLLQKGEDISIFYNLGNAYYRIGDIPRAILNYEKALLRDPGNADVRFNLALSRSKTIDKIPDEGEMFFVSWTKALINNFSADEWAEIALIAMSFGLVLLLFYLLNTRVVVRKVGFFSAILMLLIVLLANVFAKVQRSQIENATGAIIMNTTNVKSTPNESGTTLFLLHGGTKVEITDASMTHWKEIALSDGKKGWVMYHKLEQIR